MRYFTLKIEGRVFVYFGFKGGRCLITKNDYYELDDGYLSNRLDYWYRDFSVHTKEFINDVRFGITEDITEEDLIPIYNECGNGDIFYIWIRYRPKNIGEAKEMALKYLKYNSDLLRYIYDLKKYSFEQICEIIDLNPMLVFRLKDVDDRHYDDMLKYACDNYNEEIVEEIEKLYKSVKGNQYPYIHLVCDKDLLDYADKYFPIIKKYFK